MGSDATLNVRVDSETKKQAREVLDHLHMTMSEAVCIYLRQIVLNKGIPFDLKIPNEQTSQALKDVQAGKGLYVAEDVDKLLEELDS